MITKYIDNRWFGKSCLLVVLLTLFSCEEKVDWDLQMENELRLVVDAKLTDELCRQEVKLTLPVYEINGMEEAVSGAMVYFSDGESNVELLEDESRPGVYISSDDLRGEPGNYYYLRIDVQDYKFTAVAYMDELSSIIYPTPVRVSKDPELYELYFPGGEKPFMMKLEMDWSHLPGYDTLSDDRNHAVIYDYHFGALSVDVNEIFAPARERVYIPPGTKIIITKESLSTGYAEYLRGVQSETSWNGGLFDVKAGDPYTNLSEGALGYFAATSILRDTIEFWP